MRRSSIPYALLIFSAAGLFDAAFLASRYFRGTPVVCSLLDGCEIVTTSAYAAIGPVPVALLGVLFYAAVFFGAALYLGTGRERVLRAIAYLTIPGFLATLWFVFVQAFILDAYCEYCLISALTSTVLFILGIIVLWRTQRRSLPLSSPS